MLDISSDQVLGGELEPEEKEELAEKIGKMLQRDRCGVSQMAVRGDAGGENGGNTVGGRFTCGQISYTTRKWWSLTRPSLHSRGEHDQGSPQEDHHQYIQSSPNLWCTKNSLTPLGSS